MKNKSLFTKNEDWSEEARALDVDIINAIKPIIENARKKGYRLNDIHYVASSSVFDVIVRAKLQPKD